MHIIFLTFKIIVKEAILQHLLLNECSTHYKCSRCMNNITGAIKESDLVAFILSRFFLLFKY